MPRIRLGYASLPVIRGSPNFGILGYPEDILNLGYPGIILSCISVLWIESLQYSTSTVLYCTVLYCIVLYCTVLYCTVLYCTVLYCTVLYCTVLYCTVLYCNPYGLL